MARRSGIEVFVCGCSEIRLLAWIQSRLGTLIGPQGAGDALVYGSPCGPVIITLRVEDGPFTGVWFNTTRTPWDTDVDCARDAARELGCVLRCDPGVTVGTAPRVASAFLEIAGANERLVDWHPGR